MGFEYIGPPRGTGFGGRSVLGEDDGVEGNEAGRCAEDREWK